jgi:hypothetical protein
LLDGDGHGGFSARRPEQNQRLVLLNRQQSLSERASTRGLSAAGIWQ